MIETRKLQADREIMHALLCVVQMMDDNDTVCTVKVFRGSMPTLAPLFNNDEQALYLEDAITRALAIVESVS